MHYLRLLSYRNTVNFVFHNFRRNRDLILVFMSCGLSSIPWESVLTFYLSTLGIGQVSPPRGTTEQVMLLVIRKFICKLE